jgi:two-component system, chemotaxis family, chemotaxis protein CheV
MNKNSEPLRIESNQMELVDFRIFEHQEGGEIYEGVYGINVSKVREIIILPKLSRVPDAPDAIEGIFNLRGVQVPAINLAKWLGLKEARPEGVKLKVIVAEFSHYSVGMMVHQASRIRRISWEDIKPPPPLISRRHGASIVGTTTLENGQTLLIIDVEKVVAEMQGRTPEEEIDAHFASHPPEQHKGRIYIVDDSMVARKQMAHSLKKSGYQVMEASDGQQAFKQLVKICENGPITDQLDLVITDVEMPVMDGYSLTTRIKGDAQLRDLPVLMHSSLSGEANRSKGMAAGCDEYMVKFEPEILLETVNRHLKAKSLVSRET